MGEAIKYEIPAIAALLEVDQNTVYKLNKAGVLNGSKIGKLFIPRIEMELYLAKQSDTLTHGNYWVIEPDEDVFEERPWLAIWHRATPDATPVRKTTSPREKQFSTAEMAQILRVGDDTIRKLCRSGELGHAHFSNKTTIPQVEVELYFAKLSKTLTPGNYWVLEWEPGAIVPHMAIRNGAESDASPLRKSERAHR